MERWAFYGFNNDRKKRIWKPGLLAAGSTTTAAPGIFAFPTLPREVPTPQRPSFVGMASGLHFAGPWGKPNKQTNKKDK
jgi:hypothetical protein